MKQQKTSERGNALIELGLVTPVIFLMLFGAIDFGRVFATTDILTGVARSAAQVAFTDSGKAGDSAGIQAAGASDAQGMSGVVVTTSYYCTCSAGGSSVSCGDPTQCGGKMPMMYVKTRATASFSTLITYPFISNPMSLAGNAEIRTQ